MKKKFKVTEQEIHMGVFDFTVVFCTGEYKEFAKFIRWKLAVPDFDEEASNFGYEPRGKTVFRRGYCPVIWLPRKPRTAREYATLAHEAIHAVYHLAEWVALPLTKDTEEVICHSVAHIVNSILEKKK